MLQRLHVQQLLLIVLIKLSNFELRAHHSLCIQFFEGKGYNENFIHNMNEIIKALEFSDPPILITDCCDNICKYCPDRNNGICRCHQKVNSFDKACIKAYGIDFGDSIKWSDLKKLAYEKIINNKKLYSVCACCQWYDVCKNYSDNK